MMAVMSGNSGSPKPPEPRISHAALKDLPELVGLLGDLFSIEQDFSVEPARQERGLRLLLQDQTRAVILVARAPESEMAVGMVSVQVLVSTAQGAPVGLVEDLVIHRDWRGRGLGSALLAGAEAWARQHGLTRLQLLADASNTPAISFYQSRSWERTRMICLRSFPG
nr:GNAT family N-acetyltransferase [uncultured Holophaga sp.]